MRFWDAGVWGVLAFYYVAVALGFFLVRFFWRGSLVSETRQPGTPAEDNFWQLFFMGMNPVFAALLFPVFWPVVLVLQLLFKWLPQDVSVANERENVDTALDRNVRHGLEGRVGRPGRAASDLRPEGLVEVDGEILEARSSSGFVNKGESLSVIGIDGFRLEVEKSDDSVGGER